MASPGTHIPVPCLMLVTDHKLVGGADALVRTVADAISGGVNVVQLREKDMAEDELVPLARALREATAGRALLFVNGSLEVALACKADGLHLPEAAPMIQRPGRPFFVGRSVHSVAAAERALSECTDYLIAGSVFPTPSHPGEAPSGTALINAVSAAVALPVLAIGGITPQRVGEVMRAGASGVAVISAILASPSPLEAAQRLRRAIDSVWEGRPVA